MESLNSQEKDALIVVMSERLNKWCDFIEGCFEHERQLVFHYNDFCGLIKGSKETINSPSLQKILEIEKAKDEVVKEAFDLIKQHKDAKVQLPRRLSESLDRLTQLTKE